MILFLDVDKKIISLYGDNGIIKIPFQNVEELLKYVGNKEFLYITNAVETNAVEVIKLIENMGISISKRSSSNIKPSHIHSVGEGTIYIDEFLQFRGKYNIHPLTRELVEKIKNLPILGHLIKRGDIEMITSFDKNRLIEEFDKKEDEKVGGVLIDGTVDEFFNGKENKHEEAIVLDLGSKGSAIEGGNINTMSELLEEMEGLD